MGGSASALFELLCRRAWVLDALREAELTRDELAATGDVSRATVRRGLDDLVEAGVVESDEAGERYSLTLTGRVVRDQFQRSTDRLLGVDRAAPWLAPLPKSAPFAPDALEAVTVREGEAARSRYAALVADATVLSGWLLARRPEQVRPLLTWEGRNLELVVPSALTGRLLAECRQTLVERLADDAMTVHETDDLPPYSLLLATVDGRRRVCLGFHEDGARRALVETDRSAAVEWAARRVADRRASATRIKPP